VIYKLILNINLSSNQIFEIGIKDETAKEWQGSLLGIMTPMLLASCLVIALLTNAPLPSWRVSWANKFLGFFRKFKLEDAEHGVALYKKNQFGVGEPNFNLMALWLIGIPCFIQFFAYLKVILDYVEEHYYTDHASGKDDFGRDTSLHKMKLESVSYYAGWIGVFVLSFFLIPVSRHSVLLVAMNWSPVHALRIHIWAGYLSFLFITLHGLILVATWFMYLDGPIYKEFIPPAECWTGSFPEGSMCSHQVYNFTGLVAFVFFFILWASSLQWFRRKYYRVFYILHVIFGSLALLGSIWHFSFIALYFLPSTIYYLASTMPTLVQALASRFRGGVKITKVIAFQDADACVEVHVSTDIHSHSVLADNHPSKYIRLCVPKISLVWHPFTVYNHPKDPSTLRFLFRPIGPFTKELRSTLVATERPVTLIDGFYRGGDHCQEALQHDHVTIAAGGVGITPFISMVNSITSHLDSIKNDEVASVLQSVTLIWAVRERGLMEYVKSNYFEDMVIASKGISQFQLKFKIFYTGKDVMESKSLGDSSDTSEDVVEKDGDKTTDNDEKINHSESRPIEMKCDESAKGHIMELGRMMPARFSQMAWNLPLFAVFTATVWLGFHISFNPYMYSIASLKEMSEETWVTIYTILFFIATAIVTEAVVLLCRKNWPAPQPDSFVVTKNEHEGQDEEDLKHTEEFDKVFFLEERRPGTDDIFADAKLSSAPGVFMCGPQSLTSMIRSEARTENSLYGLTRYALYEEVFEM
jgi:predicted ferric reductase